MEKGVRYDIVHAGLNRTPRALRRYAAVNIYTDLSISFQRGGPSCRITFEWEINRITVVTARAEALLMLETVRAWLVTQGWHRFSTLQIWYAGKARWVLERRDNGEWEFRYRR